MIPLRTRLSAHQEPTPPTPNRITRFCPIRSTEADEAGNPTTDDANNKPDWTEWDSQFFIYGNQTIPEGKEIRMSFRVRGEKAGTMQTQAHYNPGNYNFYQLFGDISYTTEWTKYESDPVTVSSNMTQESAGKFFQSVAFNLSTMRDGNTVYFDDVKLEIRDPKAPEEFSGWFNFLRKGTLSDDQITFSNGTFYNFTGRDGKPGEDGNTHDVKARIVDDPKDGKPALTVTSIAYNAKIENKTEKLDEDGNPVLDEQGNPTYDILAPGVQGRDVYVQCDEGDARAIGFAEK